MSSSIVFFHVEGYSIGSGRMDWYQNAGIQTITGTGTNQGDGKLDKDMVYLDQHGENAGNSRRGKTIGPTKEEHS